ncbi:MAG: DEAD/DEAH box helicase [Deltaproteobacteria bacterium]|nr:DEAD/DEAH box helicase [Deltaproteobacteria bacterium]
MTLPPSSSRPSAAFDLLDSRVRRWIWEQQWTELRDIQERAAEPILRGDTDVILAAATATGKTEAAFLPIFSALAATGERIGLQALYVAPLKALINDQHGRLEALGRLLDIPVHRWHGDVGQGAKHAILRDPHGVLLITPESIEALFVRQAEVVHRLFGALQYVVLDEAHAFIGTERGRQVQSLLHRIEVLAKQQVPRIGLSATLGDMQLAAAFLRPDGAEHVLIIQSEDGNAQEVKLQLRGYTDKKPGPNATDQSDSMPPKVTRVASDLFGVLRGHNHLAFANSRRRVESLADELRELSEENRVPNEFFPHHGSLSRELREAAEARIKDGSLPTTLVATTTIEMGIDIGTVVSIAQVGVPPSVAGLRQRLGRSGRRGDPAILRMYIEEPELEPDSPPQDQLRTALVQSIAMVQLMLEHWYEPPTPGRLHVSTLVQQVLSIIAQRSGAKADELFRLLCSSGPFRGFTAKNFAQLLRAMASHELLEQSASGHLLPGRLGEKLVEHHTFFAAFQTPEEYRLLSRDEELGSLPVDRPVAEGMHLIFAGRRWLVEAVDGERKTIHVVPAPGGRAPKFTGEGGTTHGKIRERMRAVYSSSEVPIFLDAAARGLLLEARASFERLGLRTSNVVEVGASTLLFPWCGNRGMDTLVLWLRARGVRAARDAVCIEVANSPREHTLRILADLTTGPLPDASQLVRDMVPHPQREKYDSFVDPDSLCRDFAARSLDPGEARRALEQLLKATVFTSKVDPEDDSSRRS